MENGPRSARREGVSASSLQGQKSSLRAREEALFFMRKSMRDTVRAWSRIQGREEAGIFPQAVDAQLETAQSLTSLRTAVSELSKLASKKDGVRQFVLRYAYFLRRTCIYRPCNLLLNQVIKIALSDECFPYTDGAYLDDSPSSPRWQKCKRGAGL